jgi:apolipoprotein N-acyltransferase
MVRQILPLILSHLASRHQPAVRLSSFGGLIGIALALAGSLWVSAVLHVSGVKIFPVARSFIIYCSQQGRPI